MTQNQIRYLSYLEEQRANAAKERENERSNKAKEKETERSDKAKELETKRSNLRNEALAAERLDYEKYGNSKASGVVRTIKAGLSDISKGFNEATHGGPVDKDTGKAIPTYVRDGKLIVNPEAVDSSNEDQVLEELAKYYRNKSDEELSSLSKRFYDQVNSGANNGKISRQARIYLSAIDKVIAERKD